MKRILTLLVALCAMMTAVGQNKDSELLQQMSQKINSLGSYRIDFALEMPGAELPSEGYCIVEGDRYLIDVEGMAQAYDGKVVRLLNHLTKEVTLDAPKPNSRSLFDNPTKAFDFDAKLFTIDKVTRQAAMIHLWLIPAEGVLDGVEQVHLVVDSDSMLPASLSYDFAGAELHINIVKIAPLNTSEDDFTFATPEGYEVIDFR